MGSPSYVQLCCCGVFCGPVEVFKSPPTASWAGPPPLASTLVSVINLDIVFIRFGANDMPEKGFFSLWTKWGRGGCIVSEKTLSYHRRDDKPCKIKQFTNPHSVKVTAGIHLEKIRHAKFKQLQCLC